MVNESRLPVVFWASDTGVEPVRDGFKAQDPADRRSIGADIKTVQWGWPVGMPVCRPLGQGWFEVRSRISDGQVARVLCCFHAGQIVRLPGFIKKSPKTPKSDLDLARKRQKQLEESL